MATVKSKTSIKIDDLINATVVSGYVDSSGYLILQTAGGDLINAGHVVGSGEGPGADEVAIQSSAPSDLFDLWVDTDENYAPYPLAGAMGGDLSGNYPNPTVVKSSGPFYVTDNLTVNGGQIVLPSGISITNPPRVLVHRSAQTGALSAGFTVLYWDAEVYDIGNFIAGGTRLTVPANCGGLYHIDAACAPAYVSGNRVGIRITVNGTTVREMIYGVVLSNCGATISFDYPLVPGQYVETWIYTHLASTNNVGGAAYNFCNMRWVCP